MVLMIVHARPELNRSGEAARLKGDGVMGAYNEARTTATPTVGMHWLLQGERSMGVGWVHRSCGHGRVCMWLLRYHSRGRVCGWALPREKCAIMQWQPDNGRLYSGREPAQHTGDKDDDSTRQTGQCVCLYLDSRR
jgi:hypothetical protein